MAVFISWCRVLRILNRRRFARASPRRARSRTVKREPAPRMERARERAAHQLYEVPGDRQAEPVLALAP